LMDGDEIDRISADAKPLSDLFPRRLGDNTETDPEIHRFAFIYIRSASAAERFRGSRLMQKTWLSAGDRTLDPFFVIRDFLYRSRFETTNWLADLDLHLRGSNLREPVLETLGSNSFRIALARKAADEMDPPPTETLPDLIADALAGRNYTAAIQLLDQKRNSSAASHDDLLLLTYLYCLNHDVPKAESIANTIPKRDDALTSSLWEKLQAEYGFRPPD
jgi:hypothetical protein